MYYSLIRKYDVANGPGVRVSLFVSGCDHHCKGCFQPETWNPEYGKIFDKEAEKEIMDCLSEPQVDGITLLGGDPLYKDNIINIYFLINTIRKTFGDSKSIWLYTGYRYEEIVNEIINFPHKTVELGFLHDIMMNIDVLVDCRFEEDKKDLKLQFRGSSNQRLIDVKKSMNYIGSELKIYHKNKIEDKTYILTIKESNKDGYFD